MGIRIHRGYAPLGSWCRTTSPPPENGLANPEDAWQERIAKHLVPSPGHHIYPSSASGQYDLRLRSQLMLPPENTVFLLTPTVPLAPTDGSPKHPTDPPAPTNGEHTAPLARLCGVCLPSRGDLSRQPHGAVPSVRSCGPEGPDVHTLPRSLHGGRLHHL